MINETASIITIMGGVCILSLLWAAGSIISLAISEAEAQRIPPHDNRPRGATPDPTKTCIMRYEFPRELSGELEEEFQNFTKARNAAGRITAFDGNVYSITDSAGNDLY